MPGAIDASGALRDLSRVVKDIRGGALFRRAQRLRAVKVTGCDRARRPAGLSLADRQDWLHRVELHDHAREVGARADERRSSSRQQRVAGPYDSIVRPRGGVKLDYGSRAGRGIGRDARNVSEADG